MTDHTHRFEQFAPGSHSHNSTGYYDPNYTEPQLGTTQLPIHTHTFTQTDSTNLMTSQISLLVSLVNSMISRIDKLEERINNAA